MRVAFLMVCALAAGAPLLPGAKPSGNAGAELFPGWPETLEGRALTLLPLTAREKRFEAEYPGRFGRFSDGDREILMRFAAEHTRKLHPTSECFKASGYKVEPLPVWIDAKRVTWGAFKIWREDETMWIYERIYNDRGDSFSDVSAWYWAAVLGKTHGPWWYLTISEREPRSPPSL